MPSYQHGNFSLSLKFLLGVYYGPAGMSFTFLYLLLEKKITVTIFYNVFAKYKNVQLSHCYKNTKWKQVKNLWLELCMLYYHIAKHFEFI